MKGLLSVTLVSALLGSATAFAQPAQSSPNHGSNQVTDSPSQAAQVPVAGGAASVGPQPAANPASSTQKSADASVHWLKDPKTNCSAEASETISADAISWTGRCEQGFAAGQGTLTYTDQGKAVETVTTEFDKGIAKAGHAEIKWHDGSSYAGDVVALKLEGTGMLTTAAGDSFEGHWAQGQLSGWGEALWANGDKYDGDWRDGKATGHGVQIWADGRKYDGDWQNDQPNGHGVVTRKDGSRYSADFADGHPQNIVELATATAPDATTIKPATAMSAVDSTTAPAPNPDKDAGISPMQHPGISEIAGKKFVAIDGSSLTLTTVDNGMTREIVAPNGNVKKNLFSFLGDKLGSVSDGDDAENVVGVFRLTDKGIATEYADGRSELLFPNSDGGVSMELSAPDGKSVCMAWYPDGHHFSMDDRQAALAEYANKLGISEPHNKKAKVAPKPSCGTPAAPASAIHTEPDTRSQAAMKLTPLPRPDHQASLAPQAAHARKPSVSLAGFTPPVEDKRQDTVNEPIQVRESRVHTIDADASAATPGGLEVASNDPAAKDAAASKCLSIESDGQHWNFHNRCGFDVQFAYCLMNGSDPLASCSKGAVSGSVAPNGSSALVVDKSLAEQGADHDFRWVACAGGAGEVVVHLDRSDPPQGRCVRPGAG